MASGREDFCSFCNARDLEAALVRTVVVVGCEKTSMTVISVAILDLFMYLPILS